MPKLKKSKPKFVHDMDLCFAVPSDEEDYEDLTADELLAALEKRVNYLKLNPDEVLEACGHVTTSEAP